MQSFIQRNRIFFLHASFWCVYFSFFYYSISFPRKGVEPDFWETMHNTVYQVISMLIIGYLNYFYFLKRFLIHKSFIRYLLEFVPSFAAFIFLFLKGKQYVIDGCTGTEKWVYSERFAINVALSTLFIVVFVGMLRFAEDWFELEAKRREVENEKLMAELRFLKAQINPHFLFNTLNNLYYLAFTNSPNTTEVIAMLSQMMRYMIHDSNHAQVPLSKEIEYMENYISLEKLRLNGPVRIDFNVEGRVEGIQIVPLILITFLENAFKHGISTNSNEAFIKVNILLEEKSLIYIVENSKLPTDSNTKSGIGLQNVRRRLELSYPDKYKLDVKDSPDTYWVQLKLQLD
jgi:two-component system, LytTR family, sensor histidine kinase AlgZ